MAVVIVVDPQLEDHRTVGQLLTKANHTAHFFTSVDAALACIRSTAVDAILVDVVLDRLVPAEFVKEVRSSIPNLPVIVMSSGGHEQAVIQALQSGASYYIPRDYLAKELVTILGDVLAYSREENCENRMMSQMTELRCTFRLENDRSLIPPMVSYLQRNISRMGICGEADVTRIGIALDEALVNALQHGNLELDSALREQGEVFMELAAQRSVQPPYADRRLTVNVHLTSELAEVVIRDEGPGFDVSQLPDPRTEANMDKVSGRGILLMRTFMDEVHFNDSGNEVTLRKRSAPQDAPTASPGS